MTRSRRAAATLLTMALSALGLAVTAPAAQAAPPVTVPDATSMYAGNVREVDVLANDSDADGKDDLAVCRMGEKTYRHVFADPVGEGLLFIYANPEAKPGTYTFTYYACDFETLVPGTVTVTIEPEPEVTAKALPGKPGKIKVTNPADVKIRFLYGSFEEEEPDGTVKVTKNSSVVLNVRRTRIDWIAYTRKGEFIRQGTIKNITLPPGTTPPAAGRSLAPRLAELWSSAV
ncbi:Ig-like domain-containing protein [Nocardioides sp.]|uniref:Ig-like domain-containing protein n=1 Tax=Nocardioides sp. TaxID=35761 RepID=UPI001A183D2B|nr:Ig-like domain-containing protein [Nocardioides sp.]MBJ7356055.1 hypothetical protein [Nocardioides sp.]